MTTVLVAAQRCRTTWVSAGKIAAAAALERTGWQKPVEATERGWGAAERAAEDGQQAKAAADFAAEGQGPFFQRNLDNDPAVAAETTVTEFLGCRGRDDCDRVLGLSRQREPETHRISLVLYNCRSRDLGQVAHNK